MTSGSRSSPKVRRAVPGDEQALRVVRLEALRDAPAAFCATIEGDEARPASDWLEFITSDAVFLLDDGGRPRGMAACVPHGARPDEAFLMAMWVDPVLRGTGGADALVQAVVAHARDSGRRALRLHVGEPNTSARRCYERNGFVFTGEGFVRERDGEHELEMCHALGPVD